jgi:hypothetical protein
LSADLRAWVFLDLVCFVFFFFLVAMPGVYHERIVRYIR